MKRLKRYIIIKRFIDVCVASGTLLVLSPIFLLIAILVKIFMGSPVFFRTERAGIQGKPFVLYKYRTMTNSKGRNGLLLSDEERITRLGRFLRRTSIDELPQIINVLKGEMSIVGPRPLPVIYISNYNERQKTRLEALPGITGLCQVKYRKGKREWKEKIEWDATYIENRNTIYDFRIILMTVVVLLKRMIINRSGKTTSDKFEKEN